MTNLSEASSVLVSAQVNAGKDRICQLFHETTSDSTTIDLNVAGISFRSVITYFEFQNVKYEFDVEKNTFVPLVYPTGSCSEQVGTE